jgi:hypothetical protein
MDGNNRLWQILLILATLLTAFVPAYVAYDLHGKGTVPEKRVELTQYQTIDPLRDLSALGKKVTLSLRVENLAIDNLAIVKALLHNAGRTPILPSEYHENISVNVQKPWKILTVEDDKWGIEFKWKRISDIRFEAEPALLNPGDLVSTTIYVTNTQFKKTPIPDEQSKVNVEWKARIVNLRTFTTPPRSFDLSEKEWERRHWGIYVELGGWSLPFTIVTAMLFQTLYLHFLFQVGFLRGKRLPTILLVLGASFLSFAAAESMATYLFGNSLTRITGVPHWMNAPWIIVHAVVLIILYRKWKSRQTKVS